jgi:SAM-dependent methyltransferase
MQDETIITEFTQQAEAFNASAVARDAETLDALVRLAAPQAGERWLEAACGPGIISRNLAPRVGEVHGVDLTPAMVELARREAAQAGLGNATFAVGDATALELPTASVDGAIARFTIHHIPVPARLVEELSRVVRPGGRIVLADHIADFDADAAAWSQEIERLRDPSHWACLPLTRLRALPEQTGLKLEHEQLVAMVLDFDDWLQRGSGGPAARPLIERSLPEGPARAECFRVMEHQGHRVLELQMWLTCWRR